MIGLSILTVLIILIICFLIIPVKFIINTVTGTYSISQPVFFRVRLIYDNEYFIKIKIRILFIWFNFHPLVIRSKSQRNKVKDKTTTKKKSMSTNIIWDILKEFKLKRLNANIDTGDFPLNAQLLPIAQQFNGKNTSVNVNFNNNNTLNLLITFQLYKIVTATIKNRYTNN